MQEERTSYTNKTDTMNEIENTRKRIGREIVEMRVIRKMTQEDVANKAGLRPNHISRIENGKFSVGLDTLAKIAGALDCSIELVDKRATD